MQRSIPFRIPIFGNRPAPADVIGPRPRKLKSISHMEKPQPIPQWSSTFLGSRQALRMPGGGHCSQDLPYSLIHQIAKFCVPFPLQGPTETLLSRVPRLGCDPVLSSLRPGKVWGGILSGVSPPHDELLWFQPKEPKPCSPVRGPSNPAQSRVSGVPPLPHRIKMARELAPLKQPSPRSRFGTPAPPRPKARKDYLLI